VKPVDSQFLKRTKPPEPKGHLPAVTPGQKEAIPTDRFQVQAAPNHGADCHLGCQIKNGLDQVWQPIKKGAIKAAKLAKLVGSGLVTAVKVAPSVGSLVAASVIAKVEGLIPGKEKLSAIEWLQARAPKLFNKALNDVFGLIGNSTVNSTGLSIDNLIEIEEHIYKSLSPEVDANGKKKPAHFISQLAQAPFRKPDAAHAAFVYLGEGRAKESKEVMSLWNGESPPTENPYDKKSDLHRVWEVLEEKAQEKKLPVFIDLDGDARTFTSTEYISKEIMSSMVTRHNDFGDGFQDAGLYYAWMATRQESFYDILDPWMAKQNPDLHNGIEDAKRCLTPPWLGGEEGLGPWPSPRMADQAYNRVEKLAKKSGNGAHAMANFADTLVALDQDIVTGTMTHWMKLLKGSGAERREKLLGPLAKAWVGLNVGSAVNPTLAIPKGSPNIKALEGPPPVETSHQYDRANAVGEVVDHTLDGLGILERKEFMTILKDELRKNIGFVQGQDDRFAAHLGESYEGIDFGPVLENRQSCDDTDLKRRLLQLKSVLHENNGLSEKDQAELHRHYAVADWLVNSQKRYGDVHFGLIGHSEAFKENPLSVSQFFDQMEPPNYVTMLGPGPSEVRELGDETSTQKLKVSLFREGGGGKGMAYPTPSRALKAGLKSISFEFDDGGGNSAGVIPALLEAAGFNDDEVEEISARLDFKEFNADAIPLLGGTDPKIGGVNHTGLFSSQKMYKDLYGILSKKLGVEGRPILFRDLPQRIAMTATVMNTDLPEDDPLRSLIDDDKRIVMNSENTPNFDVIGAVTASTAVPGYFNAPQMQIARSVEVDGQLETKLFRMQFVDGGVVDNFPISAAKKESDGKTVLVVVPAFYETIDPETGEKVSLSTLNFDDEHVAAVNRENSAYYEKMMPKLDSFLSKVSEQGYTRVILGMNLTDLEQQKVPVIQGQTEQETATLLALADEQQLAHMTAKDGRDFMQPTVNGPSLLKKAAGGAFNWFVDGQTGESNEYRWGLNGSQAIVGRTEEENLLQVIRGVGSSALATDKSQRDDRLFEKLS
jgi:predicted acylesterase/phospholipase RssA